MNRRKKPQTPRLEIRVGGFYANAYLIRELVGTRPFGDIYHSAPGRGYETLYEWRAYEMRTGQPTGDMSWCSAHGMRQWADREATAEEIARLDTDLEAWWAARKQWLSGGDR